MNIQFNPNDPSLPPLTDVIANATQVAALTAYEGTFSADPLTVRLDTSGTTFTPQTDLSLVVQAAGPGYAAHQVTTWSGPYLDPANVSYYISELATFVPSATSATPITGVYVTQQNSAGTQATATATESGGAVTAVSVTAGGTKYLSPPLVSFTGGGGSGAAATAVISGGTVTAINVTVGGTGYTAAPTVVVEPPAVLVGGGNFATPLGWDAGTAIPLTVQLTT